MTKLLHDDADGLNPDYGSYTGTVGVDQAIADFVGTAPGSFTADFAVTDRTLTPDEAAKAAADGRSFAYVPFAASPVALMTLVPNTSFANSQTILPSEFCQHIPLTLEQLDGLYGSPAYANWGDSHLFCTLNPNTPLVSEKIGLWANLDPTMENHALMALLDSTTDSENAFKAALTTDLKNMQSTTSDPTPSEHWPLPGSAIAGGDETTIQKLIGFDQTTGKPSTVAAQMTLGAIMPVESDWTGDPLGVVWNLPTAAVQNGAGDYVAPSADAAKAAEGDATLAATSDPTTNNVVTFNASSSDPAAYNNNLMLEGYLVVPMNGLPTDKASGLAQLIRYVVGGKGEADISALGAAPSTAQMVTADLAVAHLLDTEAASASTTTTTTTTTTTAGAAASTATGDTGAAVVNAASSTASGSSPGGLAVTGDDPRPFVVLGLSLAVCGELARRVVRRRRARP